MTESVTAQRTASSSIARRDFHIATETPGIELHIRNKRPAGRHTFDTAHTTLLMHAATYGAESLYDIAAPRGCSFMDHLAHAGQDVYAVDVRGYGDSTRPAAMQTPAADNAPIVRTEDAVRDFGTAVSYVRAASGLEAINIVGMSWGGSVVGAHAARKPETVRRLCLIAPQWLDDRPSPIDTGGTLGAYRTVSPAQARARWLDAIPEDRRDAIASPELLQQWTETTFGTDPDNIYRVPSGVVLDKREYWGAGQPFYEPGDIQAPVLLLHGEWDRDVPLDTNQAYFKRLRRARSKRWVEFGEATHMLILERHRQQAFEAIAGFLGEPDRDCPV